MNIIVGSSVNNAGSSALDFLIRSPGVVNNQENNIIALNGKDGLVVMINGKINLMPAIAVLQLLAGMHATNIERIELIITPPANFDAEGKAGYINIVLKTGNLSGTNGNFALTTGYGRKPVMVGSINFNHRSGRWHLYVDYSFAWIGLHNRFCFYRSVTQVDKNLESQTETDQHSFRRKHTGSPGLDIDVSRKTMTGI